MTDNRAAGAYALAFLAAGGIALALSGWIMDISGHATPGIPSGLEGWALNIIPASVVGVLVYLGMARLVGAGLQGFQPVAGHVRRSAALYLAAVGFGALLLHDGSSPEFWSLGQIVLWLSLAAAGGVMADALTVWRRRRHDVP